MIASASLGISVSDDIDVEKVSFKTYHSVMTRLTKATLVCNLYEKDWELAKSSIRMDLFTDFSTGQYANILENYDTEQRNNLMNFINEKLYFYETLLTEDLSKKFDEDECLGYAYHIMPDDFWIDEVTEHEALEVVKTTFDNDKSAVEKAITIEMLSCEQARVKWKSGCEDASWLAKPELLGFKVIDAKDENKFKVIFDFSESIKAGLKDSHFSLYRTLEIANICAIYEKWWPIAQASFKSGKFDNEFKTLLYETIPATVGDRFGPVDSFTDKMFFYFSDQVPQKIDEGFNGINCTAYGYYSADPILWDEDAISEIILNDTEFWFGNTVDDEALSTASSNEILMCFAASGEWGPSCLSLD